MPFISVKDVLPYCTNDTGYTNLIRQNPRRIIIFFGEERHITTTEWNKRFINDLPGICPYSPDMTPPNKEQFRLLTTLKKHLELITNLKEIILSPELSKYSFNYCEKVKELLKNKYKVFLLKPYPDCPDWNNLNNIQSENVSIIDYLWEYPFLNIKDIEKIIEIFN